MTVTVIVRGVVVAGRGATRCPTGTPTAILVVFQALRVLLQMAYEQCESEKRDGGNDYPHGKGSKALRGEADRQNEANGQYRADRVQGEYRGSPFEEDTRGGV